jgi:hypothetical protein
MRIAARSPLCLGLDPPPRILDRERALRGFAFLREIVGHAQDMGQGFRMEIGGKMVGVRLLGISEPLIYS